MKVVFMGFDSWGQVVLERILKEGYDVPLVYTHHSSDRGSQEDIVRKIAQEYNIPVITRNYLRLNEDRSIIEKVDPDVIIMSNWRTHVKSEIFDLPKLGSFNIHDGKLPFYKGFSPVQWAVVNGESESGVTIHKVNAGLDTGPIAFQECVSIEEHDSAYTVYQKSLKLFPELVSKTLKGLESGTLELGTQIPHTGSFFYKRGEADKQIDWNRSIKDVYNLIRAHMDPYANAYSYHNFNKLYIKKASYCIDNYNGTPGTIVRRIDTGVVVLCGRNEDNSNQGLLIEELADDQGNVYRANDYFPKLGGRFEFIPSYIFELKKQIGSDSFSSLLENKL